jgi:hypothetical protein
MYLTYASCKPHVIWGVTRPAAGIKDEAFTMYSMFPRIDRQMIWRDIVPIVALVLALMLTFWTRDDASAQYSGIQLDPHYQGELHVAN